MIREFVNQIPAVDKVATLPVITVPLWMQYLNGGVAVIVGLGTVFWIVFRVLAAYQDWQNKKSEGSHD